MFDQIKKWLDATGGKYIIVEDEEPRYIIMKIEDFSEMINNLKQDQINQEIISLQETAEPVDIPLDKE